MSQKRSSKHGTDYTRLFDRQNYRSLQSSASWTYEDPPVPVSAVSCAVARCRSVSAQTLSLATSCLGCTIYLMDTRKTQCLRRTEGSQEKHSIVINHCGRWSWMYTSVLHTLSSQRISLSLQATAKALKWTEILRTEVTSDRGLDFYSRKYVSGPICHMFILTLTLFNFHFLYSIARKLI